MVKPNIRVIRRPKRMVIISLNSTVITMLIC